MGVFHTSTEDEVKDKYPQFYVDFLDKNTDFTYPNDECGNDVRKRVSKFLSEVVKKPYDNVVLVCHGGVIRSILCYLLGMEQHKRFNIHPDNCGISLIKHTNKFQIVSINEVSHLNWNIVSD